MEAKTIHIRLDGRDLATVYTAEGTSIHFTGDVAPAWVSMHRDSMDVFMRAETPFFLRHQPVSDTLFISGHCYIDQEYVYAHLPQPRIVEPVASEAL